MEQDKLDKFIKEKVEQHQTPTDPDLLWQKIQAKQKEEKKPKRRFLIFWLWGGAFLLGGLLLFGIYQFSNMDASQPNNDLSLNENIEESDSFEEKGIENNDDLKNNNDINQELKSDQKNVSSLSPTTGNKKINSIPVDDAAVKSVMSNSITAEKNMESAINDSVKKQEINIKNKSIAPKKTINITSVFNSDKTENTTASEFENNEELPIVGDDISSQINSENISTEKEEAEKNDKPFESLINNNSSLLEFLETMELMPIVKMQSVKIELKVNSTFIEKEKADSLEEEEEKNEKQWSFSNGAAFTYGQASRTLSSRASAPAEYLQIRNDTETSLDAVRVNLDFMAQHHSGFYLKTGLEYEQINERFDFYTERDSTEIAPNQVLAISYAMDGSSSQTTGNGEVLRTHWLRRKKYNHYRSFDIPILVGYNPKKEERRLGWFIEGGAAMNLRFSASGEITDTTGQAMELADNSDLFKTRTGISLLGAAGLTYKIANKFSIWTSPAIRYNLSSATSDENTLSQKYVNIGLQMGIRYHWSK